MKPATSLMSLAATMKPAPAPAAQPEPPRVVAYRRAETRAATRQLSGHFPAEEAPQAVVDAVTHAPDAGTLVA